MTEENNVEVEEKKPEGMIIDTDDGEISVDLPSNVETTDQPPVQTATDLTQPPPPENPLEPEPLRQPEPEAKIDLDQPPPPAEEPTCEQLVTRFQELARDKQEIDNGITSLENAQKTFQDENINKSLDDARSLKKEVDEEIRKVMEQSFGKNCKNPPPL